MTVLDRGAVVTCEGSNMNSDGSTHTDQAAATLQVQGEVREWNVRWQVDVIITFVYKIDNRAPALLLVCTETYQY